MVSGQDIIDKARECLGVRFRHQGRDPKTGIDCIGLLVWTAKEIGLPVTDCADYRRIPDGKDLIRHLDEKLDRISIEEAKDGDVLVFWIMRPHLPQHVGFKANGGIIHTYAGAMKVIESPLTERWQKRIYNAYRVRGIK